MMTSSSWAPPPCRFFNSAEGCLRGPFCAFAHIPPSALSSTATPTPICRNCQQNPPTPGHNFCAACHIQYKASKGFTRRCQNADTNPTCLKCCRAEHPLCTVCYHAQVEENKRPCETCGELTLYRRFCEQCTAKYRQQQQQQQAV